MKDKESTNLTDVVVTFSIADDELVKLYGPVPFIVQLRQQLNKAGFKFVDDNRPSLIINENPIPLGKLTVWYDIEKCVTHYKQILIITDN